MNKLKKIILISIIVIINTITVYGTQFNVVVRFTGEPIVSDKAKVKANVTDELNATINAEGLTKKGEHVTVVYQVENITSDLIAKIELEIENSNKEYFLIQTQIEKDKLQPGEKTKVTVKIELIKTPISEKQISKITMKLNTELEQPSLNDEPDNDDKKEPNKDDNPQNPSTDSEKDNILDGILPNTGINLPTTILLIIFVCAMINIIYNIVKEKNQEDE